MGANGLSCADADSPPDPAPEALAAPSIPDGAPTPGDSPADNSAAGDAVQPASEQKALSTEDAPEAEDPPRLPGDYVYAKARHVWINPAPQPSKGWLGYLTVGGSVRVKGGDAEAATTMGAGCDRWVAIEPTGYVCIGENATLNPKDPEYVALLKDAPNLRSPWPYNYAESIGAPRYKDVPPAAEQRQIEWDLEQHQAQLAQLKDAKSDADIAAINEWLVGVDPSPAGQPMPELFAFGPRVREHRARVARGSTVAFTRSFDHDGRAWLLTSDHAIVPKDRVRAYPQSKFKGLDLNDDLRLPLAFARKQPARHFKKVGDEFVPTDGEIPIGSAIMVKDSPDNLNPEGRGPDDYLATTTDGIYVKSKDVTVAIEAKSYPFSETQMQELRGERPREDGYRYTWLEVSVLGGWMVAYEGTTPIFATMISGGRGGIPVRGIPAIETAATPTGTFRVDGKFQTATMVSSTDSSIVHADVQYVMNFSGPHALHGAYWHDDWGQLKSGGCVNLAPIDARRIFLWTEPQIPSGWHGIRSVKEFGPTTRVVVHQ